MAGKKDTPPPLPHEILERVCRLARFEGRSILILSGVFAVLAALNRDVTGALAGCLAAGTGALELNGVNRLRQSDASGLDWLVRSQLLLLATVLFYAGARIAQFDPSLLQQVINSETRAEFSDLGLTEEQILPLLERGYRTLYVTVAIVTFFYQGAMALYYHRRRDAIQTALAE